MSGSHCGGETQQQRATAGLESGEAEEVGSASPPCANRDSTDYCAGVYIVYTLLIPKYTVYTFA